MTVDTSEGVLISTAESHPNPQLVRQFRKGPVTEQEGFTTYSKCVAQGIDTEGLERSGILGATVERLRSKSARVVHAKVFNETDLFVFDFGCIVIWGCSRPQLARLIESLLPFTQDALTHPPEDRVTFCPKPHRTDPESELSCILGDTIYLSTESVLEKLAYSYALSQGVKLDVYERTLSQQIDLIGDLPADLAETGVISLSSRTTNARLGGVFLLQYEVNLHSDFVEVPPDTFWDLDVLHPVYALCRSYLDIDHRLKVLNKRLRFMRGFYSMLQSEAQVRDTNKLDWIIILGIIGEVLVAAMQMTLVIYQYYYPHSLGQL